MKDRQNQGGYYNGSGRSFDQIHFCDLQGKFTTVQVHIQQLYVHCPRKSTRVPVSPVLLVGRIYSVLNLVLNSTK